VQTPPLRQADAGPIATPGARQAFPPARLAAGTAGSCRSPGRTPRL